MPALVTQVAAAGQPPSSTPPTAIAAGEPDPLRPSTALTLSWSSLPWPVVYERAGLLRVTGQ